MEFTLLDLKEKFSDLIHEVKGDPKLSISSCSAAEISSARSLCLVGNEKQLHQAFSGAARAFLLPWDLKDKIEISDGRSFLFSKNHSLAHTRIAELVHGRYPAQDKVPFKIDPRAIIAPSSKIGQESFVGPNVIIGEDVTIGSNSYIGANCVIQDGTRIGDNTFIWPMVFIGANCVIGNKCQIHPNTSIGSEGYGFAHDQKGNHYRIPQIGNVVVEDHVEIGSNVAIDRATFGSTVIGEGTKLDNIVHIAHNVKIGKNCLLTSGFTIGGSCNVGDNVYAGGNVTIRDHVNICSNVRLAGGSGLNNHVTEPGDYGGHPLQPVRDYLKTTMCLPHLPEFRKLLRELEAEVRKNKTP